MLPTLSSYSGVYKKCVMNDYLLYFIIALNGIKICTNKSFKLCDCAFMKNTLINVIKGEL